MENRLKELESLLNEKCKDECEECNYKKECEEYLKISKQIELGNTKITGRCNCGGVLITQHGEGIDYTICSKCDYEKYIYDL